MNIYISIYTHTVFILCIMYVCCYLLSVYAYSMYAYVCLPLKLLIPVESCKSAGGTDAYSLWAVFMAARVKVFSDTQKKGALNFKWNSRVGLKRRRRKSVEGFTPLSALLILLLHLFFLSLLSTFSKSIYILTPGCRGMLSCCYAT